MPDEATAGAREQMRPINYRVMFDVEDDHWWFVGRRAIVVAQIEALIAERKALDGAAAGSSRPETSLSGAGVSSPSHLPRRILDIGCGTGATISHLRKYGCVQGVDVSPLALRFCRERGEDRVVCASATELPFADNSFELITALDVVEHLDDDRRGLNEIQRVLVPGGTAIIFVPAFQSLWGPNDVQSGHKRRYRESELNRVVSDSGLTISTISYANVAMFLPIWLGRKTLNLLGRTGQAENEINHPAVNRLLTRIFASEANWLRRYRFPFGVSILCVAHKTQT
jgi:SAM-dependent methyltransferase